MILVQFGSEVFKISMGVRNYSITEFFNFCTFFSDKSLVFRKIYLMYEFPFFSGTHCIMAWLIKTV